MDAAIGAGALDGGKIDAFFGGETDGEWRGEDTTLLGLEPC